ncbi:MAG: hypothetical protein KAS54_09685 [Dehalococcoidia bacterium]|nr:hypothetical protein [Dehalococcoidia bacterium]
MKNILFGGIFIAGLGLLGASFAIPTFAHEPSGGEATLTNQEVWEYMQEACEVGDWDAMAEAIEETHGEGFSYMPCHEEGYHTHEDESQAPANPWDGMWDHMGGGMMD